MKFLNAIKLSQENNYKNYINIISSFNFDNYKYFLNAYFKKFKIDLKIKNTFSNNIEINLLNYSDKSSLWIFLDWSDLISSASFRSNDECKNFTDIKFGNKNENIIKIIDKLSRKVSEILIFAPHTTLINDYASQLSFSNKFNSIELWNSFLKKIDKTNNKKIKCVNESFNKFEICTENLFRSNTPIDIKSIEKYSINIASLILKNKFNKKLIITDLDDTLWRGTLGDKGAKFVSWEQDNETFKFLYYQKMLKESYFNGKILAIASKNEISNLNNVFKRRDFILKKNYWSSIQCSWKPKSEMIYDILQELNLGEDSFLFIDNTEFELKEVKRQFPKANYLKFPEENIKFINFVKEFYSYLKINNTKENLIRNKSYQALKIINKNSTNIDSFLKKINMRCLVSRVVDKNEERPLELINKTNQFNLNGIRLNENDWYKYFKKNYHIMKFNLNDNIAKHGIIGILVSQIKGDQLNILSLVLSCRVFSRGMELVFLKSLIRLAIKNKVKVIKFNFKKTNKNFLVEEFFKKYSIKNFKIDLKKFKLNQKFLGEIKFERTSI